VVQPEEGDSIGVSVSVRRPAPLPAVGEGGGVRKGSRCLSSRVVDDTDGEDKSGVMAGRLSELLGVTEDTDDTTVDPSWLAVEVFFAPPDLAADLVGACGTILSMTESVHIYSARHASQTCGLYVLMIADLMDRNFSSVTSPTIRLRSPILID
jgi:hypothetical protein